MERGSFDINSREPEFILDETKTKVEDIRLGHQETSTLVIESFMIDANDVWGDFAERSQTPFVYRNHDPLTKENEVMLRSNLSPFGLHLPKHPNGIDLQRILEQVKKTSLKEPITAYILRSLRHAYYATANNGHLGLGINDVQKYLQEKLAKQSAQPIITLLFYKQACQQKHAAWL